MKVLQNVSATPEQLLVLRHDPKATLIIRGAAGSGKTTTALLRLHLVVEFWQQQFARSGQQLNVLVLTFNRTLAGYIEALAQEQVKARSHVTMQIATFGSWAREKLGGPSIIDTEAEHREVLRLGAGLGLPDRFLIAEVEYATGRFLPEQLGDYVTTKREGRGVAPAMPQELRKRLIAEVIAPLHEWKRRHGVVDWNDMAVALAQRQLSQPYHVVVMDETQDFHANQVRAVMNQVAAQHSATFVLDGAQRIYPHFFRWSEVGVATAGNVRTLSRNQRNSRQIAAFARPLIDGIDIGPDGAIPDFNASVSNGPLPWVITGRFRAQIAWAIKFIKTKVDLATESVAFLHPFGKGWFKSIRDHLSAAGLPYEELSRERDWPSSSTNIALSTMHSAKGLEFDHVIVLGLNGEVTPYSGDSTDVALEELRRLLAMAVGRAKKTVVIGYKPEDASVLVQFFKSGTYTPVSL